MPITMDPSGNTDVLMHHFSTPETQGQFDRYMTQLKAARLTGKLGNDPSTQYQTIETLMKDKYPQLFTVPGVKPGESYSGPLLDGKYPVLHDLPQLLADRGVIEQPKTVGQEYVYPALAAGAEVAGAVGGAVAGGALSGGNPFGIAAGAGGGAALASTAAKAALRPAFGLPAESLSQMGEDAAISFGTNAVFELLGQAGGGLVNMAKKKLFFNTPAVTGDMLDQLTMLQQGSELAGNAAFPTQTALRRAARQGTEIPPSFQNSFRELVNSSLGGSTIVEKKGFSVQRSLDALSTDWVRQLGEDGALTDSRKAAETIKLFHNNNYQLSRQVRRDIYEGASTFPGASNAFPSDSAVDAFRRSENRIDLAHVASDIERKSNFVNKDVMDYLQRDTTLSPSTPLGTKLPDLDLSYFQNMTNSPITPGSGTFQGVAPNGLPIIQFQTAAGPSVPLNYPQPLDSITYKANITSYKDLRELNSLLGSYATDMTDRAEQATNPALKRDFGVRARDARNLQSHLQSLAESAAANGHFPRETLLAFQYADKMAREEGSTFSNTLTGKIIARFADEPSKFASELLKPENAETLRAIQKAVNSIPDAPIPHTGMSQADLEAQISRSSLYKTSPKLTWEQKIRPQLQVEYLKEHLSPQSGTAFERAINNGPFISGDSMKGVHPDTFISLNGPSLRAALEQETLNPARRDIIFNGESGYQRWLTFAKTLENFDRKLSTMRAGIGSFMAVSRQSAGIYFLTNEAVKAFQGEDPSYARALVGGGLLLSPIILAKYVNNPAHYKDLILGLKREPDNFFRSRIARLITQESLEQNIVEANKHYPMLSGENDPGRR